MNRRQWLQLAPIGTCGAALLAGGGSLITVTGCRRSPKLDLETHGDEMAAAVLQHAEVCSSAYRIVWQTADKLRAQIDLFLKRPTAKGFADVRESWKQALLSYAETEGLRGFGTPADGFHPRIQSWPVDPSLLDTVPGRPRSGIVHQASEFPKITDETLLEAHQPGAGRVFVGFHVLEFLIFGSDLYDDGGGYRAYTDYTKGMGSERRRVLLQQLADLLSDDLKHLSDAWHPSQQGNFRSQFLNSKPTRALGILFTGLNAVCANGLDGKLTRALESGDQKDEVCNFSDLSLEAIRHAIIGLQKMLRGEAPGRVIAGEESPLLGLIAKADAGLSQEIASGFESILSQLNAFDQPFDQLIKPKNGAARKSLENIVKDLEKQHKRLETAETALGATLKSTA